MKEKRRDSKGRILHTGESQRTDGKYLYKYVDAFGNTKYVYAWRLTPTDPTPKEKREKPSLRELEQQIRRDIEDGIDSTGKKMTLCQLYAKQNLQRANVKKSTQKQREIYDREVIQEGIKQTDRLNEKYQNEEEIIPIFNFIYRKRIWNEKEKSYIGWERKRGMLNQFNEYLLGNIENPFRENTLENYEENQKSQIAEQLKNIKYIISYS